MTRLSPLTGPVEEFECGDKSLTLRHLAAAGCLAWLSFLLFYGCENPSPVVPTTWADSGSDGSLDSDASLDAGVRWAIEPLPGIPWAMNSSGAVALSVYGTNFIPLTALLGPDGGYQVIAGLLPDGGEREAVPRGISEDGCVVGSTFVFGGSALRPFIWCPDAGLIPLFKAPDEFISARALGVSNGIAVGEHGGEPFIWLGLDGGMALPNLGRPVGIARGIADTGRIAGTVQRSDLRAVGAHWPVSTVLEVFPDTGNETDGWDVFPDGSVLGSCGSTTCIWQTSPPSRLELALTPGFESAKAEHIALGRYPLGSQQKAGGAFLDYATVWLDGGPLVLESLLPPDSGWWPLWVVGVSPDLKRFVGVGMHDQTGQGFVLYQVEGK